MFTCKLGTSTRPQIVEAKSNLVVLIAIIVFTLSILAPTSTSVAAISGGQLNVLDFGARGDGITDDSVAFQRALDDASRRNVPLLIPPSETPYLIRNTLIVSRNTFIIGYGATLFMPSAQNVANLFFSNRREAVSNVTIEGLSLKTVRDRVRTQGFTSNLQGIYFLGVENVVLNDVTMHDFEVGFKLAWGTNGALNRNIVVDNLSVFNADTAVLVHSTDNFTMTNSVLDAAAGPDRFHHVVYLSGDTSNFLFENVQFLNSPLGGGLHLYNGYTDKAPPQNIVFRNCIIENVRTVAYVFSNSNNIKMTGLQVRNYFNGFNLWDSSNVSISNVSMSNPIQQDSPDQDFDFKFFNLADSQITNININRAGHSSIMFLIRAAQNVRISEINAFNLDNNRFVFANTGSIVRNVLIENSRVEWLRGNWHRINLREPGSEAIIRNNVFKNRGQVIPSLSWNFAGTNVQLINNRFSGFTRLSHPLDHAININNTQFTAVN